MGPARGSNTGRPGLQVCVTEMPAGRCQAGSPGLGWGGRLGREGSTEPSQGVRSRAGGPGVGPELMVAGDRGASRPASHTVSLALVGDRRQPLRPDSNTCIRGQALWRDSPRFPLGVLFLEQARRWCSRPSGHFQRMSQKPVSRGRSVALARAWEVSRRSWPRSSLSVVGNHLLGGSLASRDRVPSSQWSGLCS